MKSLRSWMVALFSVVAVSTAGALSAAPAHADEAMPMQAADPGVAAVANGLLQFEGAVNWSSVSRSWASRRGAWVTEVRGATSAAVVAAHVLELEAAMGWSSVPTWSQNHALREAWVAQTRAAATPADVARALLGLETATGWNAVFPTWRTQRGPWVTSMQAIR